jgi:hypothetical protein
MVYVVGVIVLVIAAAVIYARVTDTPLGEVAEAMGRLGITLTVLITLPVVGFLFFRWIGLAVGLVIAVVVLGSRAGRSS